MTRSKLLAAIVLVGMAVAGAAAQRGPRIPPTGTIKPVRENLYVIPGAGGNTTVFVTATGVVLVDTKLANNGEPILTQVKTVTDKPVSMIINTHTHPDHNGSNDFFKTAVNAKVEIVTHVNTKTYMEQSNPVSGVQQGPQPNLYKQNGGRGLPTRTYRDSLTIGTGNERIELHYFGPAHTGGDTFVVFPALRIAHVGDVFPNKGLPIMDRNNGGSGIAYPDTLDKAAKGLAGVDAIINGHTDAQTTVADLREYAAFLREFINGARAAKKAGKTAAQFAAEWKTPAKFVGYQPVTTEGPGPNLSQADFAKNDAQVVFDELK